MQNTIYKEALDSAVASVEMEGYHINEPQKQFCFEFISGQINKEDFIKLMLERYKA